MEIASNYVGSLVDSLVDKLKDLGQVRTKLAYHNNSGQTLDSNLMGGWWYRPQLLAACIVISLINFMPLSIRKEAESSEEDKEEVKEVEE